MPQPARIRTTTVAGAAALLGLFAAPLQAAMPTAVGCIPPNEIEDVVVVLAPGFLLGAGRAAGEPTPQR